MGTLWLRGAVIERHHGGFPEAHVVAELEDVVGHALADQQAIREEEGVATLLLALDRVDDVALAHVVAVAIVQMQRALLDDQAIKRSNRHTAQLRTAGC